MAIIKKLNNDEADIKVKELVFLKFRNTKFEKFVVIIKS